MNFDFEKDFTTAVMSTVFVGLMAIGSLVSFVVLWVSSGSFLAAIFLWVVTMLVLGVGFGLIATVISALVAFWLKGRRNYLNDRARAKMLKTSNTLL